MRRGAAPPTSSCWPLTAAGSPPTGARRRCSARPEGREAVSVPEDERVLGLLHLGAPRQEQPPPERAELSAFTTFLP